MQTINNIRDLIANKYVLNDFVIDKSGCKVIELIGESFIADEKSIFGTINKSYITKELYWYLSESLNVNDIQSPIPQIWKDISSDDGTINSNYGWAIFSPQNGNQFLNCVKHIIENNDTRRACMIYTRPTMHSDFNKDGMSDFMCTHAVNYYVRDNAIHAVVQMRSNDVVFGFKNDYAWQNYVLSRLASKTGLKEGNIIWNAGSLHVYERHFSIIEQYINTGEFK